jgi:serine/threonine protein kinase
MATPVPDPPENGPLAAADDWEPILDRIEALGRERAQLVARCRRLEAALRRARRRLRRDSKPAVNPPANGPGDPEAPPTIQGYTILGPIRDGAMGRVYKARQESLGRFVAIKILLPIWAGRREFIARFRREARLASRLAHPNIPRVLGAGTIAGRPYLVMEYAPGETAQDRLDRGEVFEEREALAIIRDVASALGHARRLGLVHRDIKPANLILTAEGVRLIDWGLARPDDDGHWATAEAGNAIGTPEYISPEQARGQIDVDIRADIFGLGATFYHMVTGRVPFGGATVAEALRRNCDPKLNPTPLDAVRPALGGGLGAVLATMMAKKRLERYHHPDDLILDLDCLLRGERPLLAESPPEAWEPLAVGPPAGPRRLDESAVAAPPVPGPETDEAIRRWDVLWLGSACLLTLALIVAVVLLVARLY